MREQTWAPGSAAVADYILRPGRAGLTAEAKLVYLALFSYMGEDGTSRPSVNTIASGCGLSQRTVRYRLGELESAGLLKCQQKSGRATLYYLYAPWDPCKACSPARDAEVPTPASGAWDPASGAWDPARGAWDPARLAAEVTHWSNPSEKPVEEERTTAAAKPLPPAVVSWRKWYDGKFAGKWPRDEYAKVLDNAVNGGMDPAVVIAELQSGLESGKREPLSWAAATVGNLFAAGVRTTEDYERRRGGDSKNKEPTLLDLSDLEPQGVTGDGLRRT